MPVSKHQRIDFIDLAKGVCIFLVMLSHLIPETNEVQHILNLGYLRMPLYFCLSGLFFKDYGGFKNLLFKKTNNILVPFIGWYIISYIIYYLGMYTIMAGHEKNFDITDVFLGNGIYNGPIWFLLSLFWSNLIFYCIYNLSQKTWVQFFGVMVCSLLGVWASRNEWPNYMYIFTSFSCMPYFFMGFLLKKTLLLDTSSSNKRDFYIMGGCLLVFTILACFPEYRAYFSFYRNLYTPEGSVLLLYLSAMLIVVAVLLLCKKIKTLPYISYIGRYSIIVLVTHQLIGSILGNALEKTSFFASNVLLRETLVFCIVFGLMAIVIPFCVKYLPYITAQKELIKTEKKTPVLKVDLEG